MRQFHVPGVPAVGILLLVDDQRFSAIAVEPYKRRDGGDSFLITWSSTCASCGAAYEVRTGTGGQIPPRRCRPCRPANKSPYPLSGRPGQPVRVQVVRP